MILGRGSRGIRGTRGRIEDRGSRMVVASAIPVPVMAAFRGRRGGTRQAKEPPEQCRRQWYGS